ncbi:hypothetical protein [Salisediminibacterium halotolerans]|uniref:NAD+ synthase n=1 Tax=Salisediminibacterium halotolerans TaxID=517425 RepID=A0A1H9RX32_9BACI|nr:MULTISPECIES: hypothetical protein [Salisediminibacterium]RLJ74109.1 NAD+ synthase [Actinophytocola xinjiangensis]RPE87797.1 hypothetical protein EDD67_1535 [Salisediminibacterium halotolerans]TWG34946.1 NAD+ synthase [Salisediminibacterium halotolerans]SER76945.1 NAD+ synthase [Salisediminibacterium haloalkalitolerans]GEL08220.1 hypothetical protein SHA02_16360 [Salisediminibacterium halotolerans]
MAFGVTKRELYEWKQEARQGEIAFLTHFWYDERFPTCTTVTKVACSDVQRLISWGRQHGLHPDWIHIREDYPHFDLLGKTQREVLKRESREDKLDELLQRIEQREGGGASGHNAE